jgi:elongation factor P
MLNYNELKPGVFFVMDGQPHVVLEFNFLRMQQRKPVAQVKMKNVISGKVVEKNFQQTDKFEEAEIEARPAKFLYSSRGESWFCEPDNQSKRFKLEEKLIGDYADLIKPNSVIEIMVFNGQNISVKMPVKVDLKVTEAPPATKGNTAQGGTKQVKLETGATVNVPLFINEGDIVRVNTDTREYVERAEKA